ncbi:hypothetical protein ABMA27_001139 [Loxostege sticticalis]|uniref:Regulatory protein zeste n=1 Tax=Loxostege sticticalis TaxID=481309 RepID=A0ABR3I1M0_LOXSC
MSKERSNNFSREELNKLKELLEKYSIIMNKKTDHASAKQKEEAWRKLTEEFNSNNVVYRTKKQLIYKFNNMKKNARKELSQEKKERRCTGGGPPPPKPSDTSEWLCSIMGESIVGLPSTHDSDFTDFGDNTENMVGAEQNIPTDLEVIALEQYKNDIVTSETADLLQILNAQENQETMKMDTSSSAMLQKPVSKPLGALENQESVKFDTSSPYAMLQKPVSTPLDPGNRKRKLIFTPLETRKKIVSVANEKEVYLKKKGTREGKLLEFAEEEHQKNMQHKEELHKIEIEFKKKLNELIIKKAALEVEIDEEKLKKLKNENKDLLD